VNWQILESSMDKHNLSERDTRRRSLDALLADALVPNIQEAAA